MKYKVTFLLDKTNLWFERKLKNHDFNLKDKYIFKTTKSEDKITNQDIVIPISYGKKLSNEFLNKNGLTLIAHAGKLPKDKGFAPMQNQILRNSNKIYISLIRAIQEIDKGPIFFQDSFTLKGTELYNEIRQIQGDQILKIIKKFLIKYPNVKSYNQKGRGNFNKRRYPKDSELNINKTIKQQFNLLRISDNEKFPSFFYIKGKKYILKIYES